MGNLEKRVRYLELKMRALETPVMVVDFLDESIDYAKNGGNLRRNYCLEVGYTGCFTRTLKRVYRNGIRVRDVTIWHKKLKPYVGHYVWVDTSDGEMKVTYAGKLLFTLNLEVEE